MAQLTPQEEEIVLRAADDSKIRQTINTLHGLDRLREVRRLLLKRFPGVRSLPRHKGGFISAGTSAEFHIAKAVVNLPSKAL